MQQLVAAEKEPITPFISKVRESWDLCENKNQKQSKARRQHNVTSTTRTTQRNVTHHDYDHNRPFSKMADENLNKSKLKTNTSTRKSTFTLVTLQSFSISGEISAEKMYVEN